MPDLMEISGIDYSQGLPTPDGAGGLEQEIGPPGSPETWFPKERPPSPLLWIGLGILIGSVTAYFLLRRKR